MPFKRAVKHKTKGRMDLTGPPGSGKTFTALLVAERLGESTALVDSEHGSSNKYGDVFNFDVDTLDNFHPQNYIDAINDAEACGYDVVIIDSLSHAWMGKNGALELVDQAAARSKSRNSFAAWREVTPLQNALVEAILAAECHVIVTLRSKVDYVVEKNERGRNVPRKVGMAPIQRDGLEYEFDVIGEMDQENTLVVTKSRCPALAGMVVKKPGSEFADIYAEWLDSGSEGPPDNANKAASREPGTASLSLKAEFWQSLQARYRDLKGASLSSDLGVGVINEVIAMTCEAGDTAKIANETGDNPMWSRDGSSRMEPDDSGWKTLTTAIQQLDVSEIITQATQAVNTGVSGHEG